jgi:hypothetical protein
MPHAHPRRYHNYSTEEGWSRGVVRSRRGEVEAGSLGSKFYQAKEVRRLLQASLQGNMIEKQNTVSDRAARPETGKENLPPKIEI